MPAIEIPYHVRLQDPPVVPPDYGNEDAPKRQDLSFVEWLTAEAHNFRILGTEAGKYMASLIATRVAVCKDRDINNPLALTLHEVAEAERIAEDYARLLGRAERAEAELARRND